MPRQSLSLSALVASEKSAAQPATTFLNCVPGGRRRPSSATRFFKLPRAVGRSEPKKLREPARAKARTFPVESTATARLCVPPPSIPRTRVGATAAFTLVLRISLSPYIVASLDNFHLFPPLPATQEWGKDRGEGFLLCSIAYLFSVV